MRIEPTELAVVQLGMQRDFVTRIFRNVKTIMRRVCRARGDQMDVDNRPRGPGVSFVDGIAVPINLQRTIEVRPRLDRTFAAVLHLSAPENCLAFLIRGLKLKPDIEGVHRSAGEEVPDLAR